MSLREQIEKALNTPFDAAKQGLDESKYAGLGVYHDGPTLETSTIVIQRELDNDPNARTSIDIKSDIGQTKGKFKDVVNLKDKFLDLTSSLPEGSYYLHADDPTKAKYYLSRLKDHPWITLSGEQGGSRTKSGEFVKYDTLKLTVPPTMNFDNQGITQLTSAEISKLPEWKAYLTKAKNHAKNNGGSLENLEPFKDPNGDIWYADPKGISDKINNPSVFQKADGKNRRHSPKSYAVKHVEISYRRALKFGQTLTLDDYLNYAKANGFDASVAKENYNSMRAALKDQARFVSQYIHDDHIIPLVKGGYEHPRNKVLLNAITNEWKGDKLFDQDTLNKLGTFSTKEQLLKADFDKVPIQDNLTRQRVVEEISLLSRALYADKPNPLLPRGGNPAALLTRKFDQAGNLLDAWDHINRKEWGSAVFKGALAIPQTRPVALGYGIANVVTKASTGQNIPQRLARSSEEIKDEYNRWYTQNKELSDKRKEQLLQVFNRFKSQPSGNRDFYVPPLNQF